MRFKHLLMCGVLTTLVAFGLLSVIVPQQATAAPPQGTYTCYTCPAVGSWPIAYQTVYTKADAQYQCRMKPAFCVELHPDSPGNPIACNGCR